MRLNRTSELKVVTILISRELLLYKFERLDILCAWIERMCEKLWPFEFLESFHCSISSVSIYDASESDIRVKCYDHFEFLESFRCSISSVSIYYAPESDLRVKSYDHLDFSRASVVQFEHLDILCTWIGHPSEKLWLFEFVESLRCSISIVSTNYAPVSDICVKSYDHWNFSSASIVWFWASRYFMRLNQTSVWKVMTIWISWELPLFNFERLDIICAWIWPLCEKLWPFEYL